MCNRAAKLSFFHFYWWFTWYMGTFTLKVPFCIFACLCSLSGLGIHTLKKTDIHFEDLTWGNLKTQHSNFFHGMQNLCIIAFAMTIFVTFWCFTHFLPKSKGLPLVSCCSLWQRLATFQSVSFWRTPVKNFKENGEYSFKLWPFL